jgi:hypothetical protein
MTLSLKFADDQLHQSVDGPDEEDYRSFWMDLRKLIMDGSPTHLPRVLSAAWQMYPDDEARTNWWTPLREAWNRALSRGPIALSVNGIDYSPGKLIDMWLNGVLFHDDAEKRRVWAELSEPLPAMAEIIVNSAVISLVTVVAGAYAKLDALRGGPGTVTIPNRQS